MNPNSAQILQNADDLLTAEGYENAADGSRDKLRDLVIPALTSAKDIQTSFYSWQPTQGNALIRVGKSLVLGRLKNIIINVLDKMVTRQQKYNELMFQAVQELAKENAELKAKLEVTK